MKPFLRWAAGGRQMPGGIDAIGQSGSDITGVMRHSEMHQKFPLPILEDHIITVMSIPGSPGEVAMLSL